jgi:hypothetical protein
MSPQITIKENYVLIEPQEGADFWEILRGVARLFYGDKIPEKNRIWLFRRGPGNLSGDDLHKLKDIITEIYPSEAKIEKTAIVVASELQSSMAELFTRIAQDLPQTFKVFSKLTDAEDWVME